MLAYVRHPMVKYACIVAINLGISSLGRCPIILFLHYSSVGASYAPTRASVSRA